MTTPRSLTAWHQRLVDVVEAAHPRSMNAHLGDAFRHDRAVGGERAFATRRFGIRVLGALPRGNHRPGGTWLRLSCELRMDYLGMPADVTTLNLAMLEDAAVVVDAVADPGGWRFEDTAIRIVGGETPTDIAVVDIVSVTGGERLLIRFPVEVHR